MNSGPEYACWLQYRSIEEPAWIEAYGPWCSNLVVLEDSAVIASAKAELVRGIGSMIGCQPTISIVPQQPKCIVLGTVEQLKLVAHPLNEDGYVLKTEKRGASHCLLLAGKTERGVLYAAFHLLRLMETRQPIDSLDLIQNPKNPLRMVNQWDNLDGSIERGYAGNSIFYKQNQFTDRWERIKDYARLLASVGINGIAINNVNVHQEETKLITAEALPQVAKLADLFRSYGLRIFLSINFASPIQISRLPTADPLAPEVRKWWRERAQEIYHMIPDFGGFLVKADSEHRPGPFTYNRSHADGANMLAEALKPFGGVVIWRCFVYNCQQDWRDRTTDRAKAAYDHFRPWDGQFLDNVILQIKNGPMDFQVREPVSPLFGAMEHTNQMLELQITQEYTGQQKHLCYLVPQWKEILDFDTFAKGEGSTVKRVVDGSLFSYAVSGITGVSNIGDDPNWTGHTLAQANLYGFGRLAWDPDLSAEEITAEWVAQTFGLDPLVMEEISGMLLDSWRIYENYTAPLGVGWMVNPGHHYGPNVDGYEFSVWGTYHFADCHGIGVNRTIKDGTGFTGQYFPPQAERFESLESCPDELLLFFHHVPYTHRLTSGETVIQHIYNTHFAGAEQAEELVRRWTRLKGRIDEGRFESVLARLKEQAQHAKEWRDVINTYFYRKSGIPDAHGRTIY